MKIKELFEAKPNSVQIKNKAGVYKKFKAIDSPGAKEWAQSYTDPEKEKADEKAKKLADKQRAKEQREAMKVTDREILEYADYALNAAMDGSDPMDAIGKWMDKKNVSIDQINKVVNKAHKVKGGLYGYIARSWGDMQRDSIADVKRSMKQGKTQRISGTEFYNIRDGKVVPLANPYGKEG